MLILKPPFYLSKSRFTRNMYIYIYMYVYIHIYILTGPAVEMNKASISKIRLRYFKFEKI